MLRGTNEVGSGRATQRRECDLEMVLRAHLLFLFLVIGTASPALALSELDLDPSDVSWDRLVLQAEEGRAEVALRKVPRAEAEAMFTTDLALKMFEDEDPTVMLMTASIAVEDPDRIYRTEVWFVGEDATAFQRIRDRIGKKGSRKTFRYFEDGVHRIRVDPRNRSEEKLPVRQWTRVREHLFAYGAGRSDCPAVLDPTELLYAISAGAFTHEDDEALEVCVFNKKTLFRVQVRVNGAESFQANYTEVEEGSRNRVAREISARRIVLKAVPDPAARRKPDPFEFFEMRSDIEILLDPSSRLPLKISGEVSGVGVAFTLTEVTLKP